MRIQQVEDTARLAVLEDLSQILENRRRPAKEINPELQDMETEKEFIDRCFLQTDRSSGELD